MNQNPAVDNDLQKAIDDITNTTNIDPVFSDPVAAPSSVPEGDTGELGEPVGPFPEPKVQMVAPATEKIAPLDPINIPDLGVPTPPTPAMTPITQPVTTPDNLTSGSTTTPPQESTPSVASSTTEPALATTPIPSTPVENLNTADSDTTVTTEFKTTYATNEPNSDINQIKTAALRDLAPLLDHLDIDPAQKFNIYRDILDDLHDSTILNSAYDTIKGITNETERAQALLYLVESINKMQ